MDRGHADRASEAGKQAMDEVPGTPASTHSSEGTERKPTPEHMQHHSRFVPSQPIPIPNAVPKERLPRVLSNGAIYMTGSKAPTTQKEIQENLKQDEKDLRDRERFRRVQQAELKRAAFADENQATSSTQTGGPTRAGVANDSDEDDEPYPPYQKHVMKPFAHQYGHTTASIAYEEGYKAGIEKGKQEKNKEKEDCKSKPVHKSIDPYFSTLY